MIFKYMFEFNNVGLFECSMDLDFTDEFLPGSVFGESVFGDDFGSIESFVFDVSEFIAFGESSLA